MSQHVTHDQSRGTQELDLIEMLFLRAAHGSDLGHQIRIFWRMVFEMNLVWLSIAISR